MRKLTRDRRVGSLVGEIYDSAEVLLEWVEGVNVGAQSGSKLVAH